MAKPKHPIATRQETIEAILSESERPGRMPLRRGFVQLGGSGAKSKPGPLADIIKHGRARALELYLLTVTWATGAPHDVIRDSRIWARAVGLPDTPSGRAAVSRNWTYLKGLKLVELSRQKRLAKVRLLREDGSGRVYTHPSKDGKSANYLQLPFEFWKNGFNDTLSLSAKAMLLIALTQPDHFSLPVERVPAWYGISESTAARGFRELREADLLSVKRVEKTAPLAPKGFTLVNHYTLLAPFGPKAFLPW
jgi:hypothetical protein